ncbi:unnamed protein product [[Candida] boidinii]|nr:unnamed protein product [[Candida] boidinii]
MKVATIFSTALTIRFSSGLGTKRDDTVVEDELNGLKDCKKSEVGEDGGSMANKLSFLFGGGNFFLSL